MNKYYIKRKKYLLDPEEVLLDRKAKEAREKNLESLEAPISRFLVLKILVISFFAFFIIFSRVFYLQVVQGANFQQRAENNSTYQYVVNAPRGIIYDRFQEPLVFNNSSFSLMMIPSEMPENEQEKDVLIKQIVEIFNVEEKEIQTLFETRQYYHSLEPILIKSNLSVDEARVFETLIKTNSGFNIVADYSRDYPFGEAFAHVLGYIGRISSKDLERYKNYPLTSMVGKDGLEAYYEQILQGKTGQKLIEVDARLNVQKNLGSIDPKKGNDIVTTLDKDLQIFFYNSLKEQIEKLESTGGAGIILDPNNGEVLSLISIPSFDPNILTQGSPAELINKYFQSSLTPLLNRAIGGLYSPGSVIKVLMALAALEENIIDPNQKVHTNGEIVITSPYNPQEKWIFRDWKNHGWVDMRQAIAVSCNVYFWAVGGGWEDIVGLGLEKIYKYWLAFGLDEKVGIDLYGEANSVLPDTQWLADHRPNDPTWKLGDTYNISIGEGDLVLTPLQMAGYIATIANNGVLEQPHLLKNDKPKEKLHLKVNPDNLRVVQEGMREVVLTGTSDILKWLPIEVAGKSGSPKVYKKGEEVYNAIFGAYAPYKNPEIVILVFIETPPTSGAATLPVVAEVVQWYWENRINKEI